MMRHVVAMKLCDIRCILLESFSLFEIFLLVVFVFFHAFVPLVLILTWNAISSAIQREMATICLFTFLEKI